MQLRVEEWCGAGAVASLPYWQSAAVHPNADPNGYELSRFHWFHTDQANQPPIINVILRYGIPVTFDEAFSPNDSLRDPLFPP